MTVAGSLASPTPPRRRMALAWKFALALIGLVTLVLVINGLINVWLSYDEAKRASVRVQREKAQAAAERIDLFVSGIEQQLGWTTRAEWARIPVEQRRYDFIRLLRQAPAITELIHVDGAGKEQLKLSRLEPDLIGSGADYTADQRLLSAIENKIWFGPVTFRRGSEPYMTIALAHGGRSPGVTIAEVNLKLIWDVVTSIKVGEAGYAFIVDANGRLVAHPDMSMVLRGTDLSKLPHLARAIAGEVAGENEATNSVGLDGKAALFASAPIARLKWNVFVQVPAAEALAPVYASLAQTAALLGLGLVLASVMGGLLAQRMVVPIKKLQEGAERLGTGALDQRIDIKTGDEIETLAGSFNQMAERIQDSYATLEAKVEARTHDLNEALVYQTGSSNILKVIASSPTDVAPVLQAIVDSACEVCDAQDAAVMLKDGDVLRFSAHRGPIPIGIPSWPINRNWTAGRAFLDKVPVHVHDLHGPEGEAFPDGRELSMRMGHRSILSVPLLREGESIGAIALRRTIAQPFSEKQIDLLQTFANQAVIAINNVRLFNETKEALETQTATSDILNVIASSPSDVQPVFDAIAQRACALTEAAYGWVFRYDGELIHVASDWGVNPQGAGAARHAFPMPAGNGSITARAVRDGVVVNVADVLDMEEAEYSVRPVAQASGFRSVLAVPMMKEGRIIGAISVTRPEVGLLPKRAVDLLRTFADQAVIAIENVRLFNETKEALARQTATSDILRVISQSPTDVTPVFDAIVAAAVRLLGSDTAFVLTTDGQTITAVAGADRAGRIATLTSDMPVDPAHNFPSRAIISKSMVHLPDWSRLSLPPHEQHVRDNYGLSSALFLPLVRSDDCVGVLVFARAEARAFTEKEIALARSFADQAVIAIENVRLFNETKVALEQQTATAEVLKVISRSAFDLQPVFDTVAENAVRLCEAERAFIFRFDGEYLRSAASHNAGPELRHFIDSNPIGLGRHSISARAALERRTVHVPDVQVDTEYTYAGRDTDLIRTMLAVPMLRGDELVGTITIYKLELKPFSDKQIALVETFAEQAVIAIENARLFEQVQARTKEVSEALEYQTATSDVLNVISRSPNEVQPVFDAIAKTAARLCGSDRAFLSTISADSGYHVVSSMGVTQAFVDALVADPPTKDPSSLTSRVFRGGKPIHVPDVEADPAGNWITNGPKLPGARARTALGVPLLHKDAVLGVMVLTHTTVRPFSDKQIALVTSFADQAVIAMNNARLFEQVQTRTKELQQSLEYQTATSDVLGVISKSPSQVEPVFEAIVATARRLCGAEYALINQRSPDGMYRLAAHSGATPEFVEWLQTNPTRAGDGSAVGIVALDKRTLHLPDALADPRFTDLKRQRRSKARTMLGVPLMSAGEVTGVVFLAHTTVRPFTDRQIELVTTFADQAVIAIENARLFEQVQARTREVTEALEFQIANSEVLKVISSSVGQLDPVFDCILSNARRLCEANYGHLFLFDGDRFQAVALHHTPEAYAAYLQQSPLKATPGSGLGRMAASRKVVHIEDITAEAAYRERDPLRVATADLGGARTFLAVPMLKDGKLVGSLVVYRDEVRRFSDDQIKLVSTFADQAVIAIENARLFEQVQAKTRDLTASLEDLRTAQDRLVQTEKLASLGQLTAGVAHEIKNPLNFVNNFADLSVELVAEIEDAIASAGKALAPKIKAEINEIAGMLKGNLAKVVHHGRRADSIVKNMLAHSRESGGERRPVDLNATVEEALNLAYHGARAEKPGFNITLERDFDAAVGQIEVFPQEFTRVLLNLIGNGFHAANKKRLDGAPPGFEPILHVATKAYPDKIEIKVRDNGTGIPDAVKARIFEPFFTTKPTGEGTGLGLSLSHDIVVKQHGGSLSVATEPGSFTEFTVILPRISAPPETKK